MSRMGQRLLDSMMEINLGNVNLLAISMMEMAIVYGVVAPVVLVVGTIAVFVDASTCSGLVIGGYGRVVEGSTRPPLSYLYVSVLMQGVMFVWYCYDVSIVGKEGVMAFVVIVSVLFLFDAIWTRIRDN